LMDAIRNREDPDDDEANIKHKLLDCFGKSENIEDLLILLQLASKEQWMLGDDRVALDFAKAKKTLVSAKKSKSSQ
jgi:hypothetical protein